MCKIPPFPYLCSLLNGKVDFVLPAISNKSSLISKVEQQLHSKVEKQKKEKKA